jgi:hypothetical protein
MTNAIIIRKRGCVCSPELNMWTQHRPAVILLWLEIKNPVNKQNLTPFLCLFEPLKQK